MKITFEDKINTKDHILIVYHDSVNEQNISFLDKESKNVIKNAVSSFDRSEEKIKTFNYSLKNKIKSISVAKFINPKNVSDSWKLEAFGGKLLNQLEKINVDSVALIINENDKKNFSKIIDVLNGIDLKSYSFEKYKTISKKKHVKLIKVIDLKKLIPPVLKKQITNKQNTKGIFLTRDLVSEPANILYPTKFVEFCNVLKKVGVTIEVLDEKKMKSLGMNALLGVSQGSVRPARVMIMRWNGIKNKKTQPLAFIGKGVTFDTGGISIKPSGGMEDMKWDMGGAGVVAGLMYSVALRKSKCNIIGAVGLVENMPDGNAQRPGDVVKSMSGQTIEVLNTDAEGRLVLADVLWYVKERYKPKLMIDLATLTGAIIVALGDRYAGMFSNDDKLVDQLYKSSKETNELVWRLPMDNEFDKLLNCQIADMKNITGTRGAGSITAAQFLKRFVGDIPWVHLDIAGVTWSKKGTDFSRPGGTGFGVRLLDNFIENNYE